MTLQQNVFGVDVAKDWIDMCDPRLMIEALALAITAAQTFINSS